MPSTPYSHLKVSTLDGILVVTLSERQLQGDALAEKLKQELLAVIAETKPDKMVLSFEEVQYIASAAFRPLLSLNRRFQQSNARLMLCGLTPSVRDVFQQLRLISTNPRYHATFDWRPDVKEAVAALKPDQAAK
jgi:anti-anti-sigma factor